MKRQYPTTVLNQILLDVRFDVLHIALSLPATPLFLSFSKRFQSHLEKIENSGQIPKKNACIAGIANEALPVI
eukprot:m.383660 g.383660  ORF g.383660 m.383660 type:complete len:73 (+) comp20982_c2_seq1:268-486(+)